MASIAALPSALPTPAVRCLRRSFHTSSSARASIFYALSALSNSRETQHLNKLTRLPRMEHSPPLKLIKTSEVDAFPCPTPPNPVPRPLVRHVGGSRSALRVWDRRALQVGRVFLANQARQTHRLMRSLARAKRREAKQDALRRRDRLAWREERRKMRNEMKAAGMWILLSIGTATALATWRFWPQTETATDSAELGRKIAARAAAAIPLPAAISGVEKSEAQGQVSSKLLPHQESAVSIEQTTTAPIAVPIPPPRSGSDQAPGAARSDQTPTRSWWKSLFWKQQ